MTIVAVGLWHLAGSSAGVAEEMPGPGGGTALERDEPASPRPSCFRGSAWLAPERGAIEFQARCRPTTAGGNIGLTVSRITLDEIEFLPIKGFRRFPRVTQGNAVHRGRCVRVRQSNGQINCSATIDGSGVIEGRIWVPAAERCSADIRLMSSPSTEPCTGVCTAVLPGATSLISGLPRGC